MSEQEKQCRICLDGLDAGRELGRLIRPCLCKGSISYVHVQCLHRWRQTSASKSAFFACPQCRYQYRFARTRIAGLATNPVIVGGLSGLLFTSIVMVASFITTFITTFFVSAFEEPTRQSLFFISPFEVAQDLITAAFRILRDGELAGTFEEPIFSHKSTTATKIPLPSRPPGLLKRFIRRFIFGLPLVGASSLVQMLLSVGALGPVQWIARYRGSRNRRNNNSRDIAALIIISLLLVGVLRALYKVYQFTQVLAKRALLQAEDAILEVS